MSQPPPRVPLSIQLAYGAGSIADGAKNGAFNAFLLYYYTAVLGLPGTPRASRSSSPSASTRSPTRWSARSRTTSTRAGGGAIPSCTPRRSRWDSASLRLFSPPSGLGTNGLFVWLVTFSIGVRLFLTFYMVPSGALGPEITESYDGRTSLVAFRWMLGWLGSIAVTGAGWFWWQRLRV